MQDFKLIKGIIAVIKLARKIVIISSVGLLAACGMKLLWEARYDVSHQKTVGTLFVDSEGNSYVGGSQATSSIEDFSVGNPIEHRGLLLKYDANGNLLWSLTAPVGESVAAIEQVGDGVVAIASGMAANISAQGDREGGIWLVSTETGDVIQSLTQFDGGSYSPSFKKMIVRNNRLYVAASTDCGEWTCSSNLHQSRIDAFDFSGNLINSRVTDSAVFRDFDVSENGTISLALVSQQDELQQLDANLNLQWSTSNNTLSAREMRYCSSEGVRFSGVSHVVVCRSWVLKFDSAGALLWSNSLRSLVSSKNDNMGEAIAEDYWSPVSQIEIDSDGNIFLAKTRETVYLGDENAPLKLGNMDLYYPLTLESDAIIAKLDAMTGNILWSDDINTSIAIRDSDFTSYFYSPVALSVSRGQALLTTQGIIGNYAPPTGLNYCLMNGCSLVEYKDRYAKTFVYNASNGRRVGATKHNMPYARATKLDGAGNLIVAGDMQPFFLSNWANFWSLGPVTGTEPYLKTLIAKSDIILQKYKR